MARLLLLAPPRRRRTYRVAVSRSVTFGPGLALPLWGWADLGQPGHLAGLAAMTVPGLLIVTNLVVTVMMIPLALSQYAWVPRRRRVAYRQVHGRDWVPVRRRRVAWWRPSGCAGAQSAYIPDRMRQVTYFADRNRCVMRRVWRRRTCSGGNECDHKIPWAGGGLTVPPNLFTLCQYHNGLKLNYSRDRDGYEHYAGDRSPANLAAAAAILHAEKLAGRNPFRGLRMAWALGA